MNDYRFTIAMKFRCYSLAFVVFVSIERVAVRIKFITTGTLHDRSTAYTRKMGETKYGRVSYRSRVRQLVVLWKARLNWAWVYFYF